MIVDVFILAVGAWLAVRFDAFEKKYSQIPYELAALGEKIDKFLG